MTSWPSDWGATLLSDAPTAEPLLRGTLIPPLRFVLRHQDGSVSILPRSP